MRTKILAVFVFLLSNIVFSQTIISGGAVSGTWTASGSPYLVQGAIMVADASTLTIEPGVYVEFQGSYKFLVLGQVLAQGTLTDSISFYPSDTITGWLGIRFDNTNYSNDTSRFDYCNFQHGNAVSPNSAGGAMYFYDFSKVKISNTKFTNCKAEAVGGALYINGSSPIITDCFFEGNEAVGSGGAIHTNSSPTISNSTFINNHCGGSMEGGGAIYSISGAPFIKNNTISFNSTTTTGGGIYLYSSNATIIDNIISYNSAVDGGGICSIDNISGMIVRNCIISNNYASSNGGGLKCEKFDLSNSVITNNNAGNWGGGIYCNSHVSQSIINSTISYNSAQKGGGVYCNYSDPNIKNCIFWNDIALDAGNEIFLNDEDSDPNITYSDIQGGSDSIGLNTNCFYLGTYLNNIDYDPIFVNPSSGSGISNDGTIADWSLQLGSPCIDAGDPVGVYPSADFIGNPRVSNGRIDIGAFESLSTNNDDNIYTNDIMIFPNPTTGLVNVETEDVESIEIFNIAGRQLYKGKEKEIDLSLKPKGLYIIKVIIDKQTITRKLIKQ